jgi:hypothetical protein
MNVFTFLASPKFFNWLVASSRPAMLNDKPEMNQKAAWIEKTECQTNVTTEKVLLP